MANNPAHAAVLISQGITMLLQRILVSGVDVAVEVEDAKADLKNGIQEAIELLIEAGEE